MFIVIEIQTTGDSTTVTPIKTFADINKAYEAYYQTLMYAAVSKVSVHTAMILTEDGSVVRSEHFDRREEVTESE